MPYDITHNAKLNILHIAISKSIYSDETNQIKRIYIQKIRRLVFKYMDTKDKQLLDKITQLCYKYKNKSPFVSSEMGDLVSKMLSTYSYWSYDKTNYLRHLGFDSHSDFFDNLMFLLSEYDKTYKESILEKSREEKPKEEKNKHKANQDIIQTENRKNKTDTGVIDIYGMSILVKKLMSIIKSKDGKYIINDIPGISKELKELIEDLIELQQFEKMFKEDKAIIEIKYEILSKRIYQYLHLKANRKLTEEEQIIYVLLEKNNILGLLEKNMQYHGEHYFRNLIPDINEKIICDLDKLFGYVEKDYFSGPSMYYAPEVGRDFKISLGALTYLMPISEIKRLYHKYRVAFYEKYNNRLNHGYLQREFCCAIRYNKFYKSFLKNVATEEEAKAEELFICATFLDVMPIFINSKEELCKKILTGIKNKKISANMCQILNKIKELQVIDIPSVNKTNGKS